MNNEMKDIPLSLYIHFPWCVQKCPYCDFNSHQSKAKPDFEQYIDQLLIDFDADHKWIGDRPIHSIFMGGGTPSLCPPEALNRLLLRLRERVDFADDIEITLEANPNSADKNHFKSYVEAGVNRLSMGIQSFNPAHLTHLGRVHSVEESLNAIALAKSLKLRSFNLDLMHGLPHQSTEQGLEDLKKAIALDPSHLSWYQLTIEPNTLFGSKPPRLPDEAILWDIETQGHELLKQAGYEQYETSAYAKSGFKCQHNLNYWRFGDYIGIGCGAHGKITLPDQRIVRTVKTKHPSGYLKGNHLQKTEIVTNADLPFEFFMNQFRLFEKCPKTRFMQRTFLPLESIATQIDDAVRKGYIEDHAHYWQITESGKLFLNSLLTLFL